MIIDIHQDIDNVGLKLSFLLYTIWVNPLSLQKSFCMRFENPCFVTIIGKLWLNYYSFYRFLRFLNYGFLSYLLKIFHHEAQRSLTVLTEFQNIWSKSQPRSRSAVKVKGHLRTHLTHAQLLGNLCHYSFPCLNVLSFLSDLFVCHLYLLLKSLCYPVCNFYMAFKQKKQFDLKLTNHSLLCVNLQTIIQGSTTTWLQECYLVISSQLL